MDNENLSGGLGAAVEESNVQDVTENEALAQVDDNSSEETKADGEEQVKRKKPGGWHRKIQKLERQNAELMERLNSINPPKAAVPDREPQLSDYENYEQYNAALVDHRVNKALDARDNEVKKQRTAEENHKAATTWQQKVDSLDDSYADYDEVVGEYSDYPVNPAIRQALVESDIGPKMAYYLAKNPDELDKINSKTPYAAAKEMARIEASLSNSKPSVKKVSNSPPPITQAKGTTKTVVKLQDMDTSQYMRARYPHLFSGQK